MKHLKRKCKKALVLFLFLVGFISHLFGQKIAKMSLPEVNAPMPEIWLGNIEYYNKTRVSLAELRGKHVILDFFSAGCSACFESFPKLNRLQLRYRQSLQIFLIGSDDYGLKRTYDRFKEKQRLQFPVVLDGSLFQKLGVDGVPYLIWIDDHGIIKALTSTTEATDENINAFLMNKPFRTRNVSSAYLEQAALTFDSAFILDLRPFKQGKLLSGSSLISWHSSMPMGGLWRQADLDDDHRYFQINGTSIYQLINIAFTGKSEIQPEDSLYGKVYAYPIFEMDSLYIPVPNYTTGEGMYCYSLVMNPDLATNDNIQRKLKMDLDYFLGYDIREEARMMPCWKLMAMTGTAEKLKSKYSKEEISGDWAGLSMRSIPVHKLIRILWANNQNEPPFVDETGICGFIDIKLEALLTDFEDLKRALCDNGLYLVKEKRLMEVIVVRKRKV